MCSFQGIGLMSGNSCDGLDICCAEFTGDRETDVWGYRIIKALTVPYTREWMKKLRKAPELSGIDLIQLHIAYGHFVGEVVQEFVRKEDILVEFAASHGHTVFHQPENGLTFQLGDGETTSAYLACPYICDFRSKDVALGGQGSPLLSFGDRYLFQNIDICVNFGGIANISMKTNKAYDVCPCNVVLDKFARMHVEDDLYDRDGALSSRGVINAELLEKLENLPYYQIPAPKSLSMEKINAEVIPLLDATKYPIPDIMRTFVEHIALRISEECAKYPRPDKNVSLRAIVTGGGALNLFLMKILKEKFKKQNIQTDELCKETICFKEGLVVAFLGMRTLLGLDNISKDITGSSSDSVSGSIHRPPRPRSYIHSPVENKIFTFSSILRKNYSF